MSKKYLWWLLAALLLFVVSYVALRDKEAIPEGTADNSTNQIQIENVATTTPVKPAVAPAKKVVAPVYTTNAKYTVVNYTNSGFVPATLSIKAGQSVRFVNMTQGAMMVASNPHPEHSDYPEFEQGKTVGYKGIYDFTFVRVGTWGYHNHLNPSKTAVIVVQ